MTTASRPGFRKDSGRRQTLGFAGSAGQVLIDPGGCRVNITGQHIPGHEGDDVLPCVFPRFETVNALDDI